jgi:hypothetical protein
MTSSRKIRSIDMGLIDDLFEMGGGYVRPVRSHGVLKADKKRLTNPKQLRSRVVADRSVDPLTPDARASGSRSSSRRSDKPRA